MKNNLGPVLFSLTLFSCFLLSILLFYELRRVLNQYKEMQKERMEKLMSLYKSVWNFDNSIDSTCIYYRVKQRIDTTYIDTVKISFP